MSLLGTLGFLFPNHMKDCIIFSTLGKRKLNKQYHLGKLFISNNFCCYNKKEKFEEQN